MNLGRFFCIAIAVLMLGKAVQAQPDFPTKAFELDVSQIRNCAYEKYYEDALSCIGQVTKKCFDEGYNTAFDTGTICVHRAYLAWDVYRESQLAETRDRMGKNGPARQALEASVQAFAPWRNAECNSELASWPEGSDEGAGVYNECMLRLTARRAVFLGVKGVP